MGRGPFILSALSWGFWWNCGRSPPKVRTSLGPFFASPGRPPGFHKMTPGDSSPETFFDKAEKVIPCIHLPSHTRLKGRSEPKVQTVATAREHTHGGRRDSL